MATSYVKDPDATLDWVFDWKALTNGSGTSDWLASGEQITGATGITVTLDGAESPVNLSLATGAAGNSNGFSLINTNTAVRVWLKDGTIGERYTIACKIETNQNRIDERTVRLRCTNR
jgi:hypothetical protein